VDDWPSITKMKRDGRTLEVFSTGSAAIHAVALGLDGTIYALDANGTNVLCVLSPAGDLIQTVGGPGEEFGLKELRATVCQHCSSLGRPYPMSTKYRITVAVKFRLTVILICARVPLRLVTFRATGKVLSQIPWAVVNPV
jgi:hypothetical protein